MARPDYPSSIYLDSNTLIRALLNKSGAEPIAELLRLAQAGKIRIVISTLSYVEVRGWGKTDPYPSDLDDRCLALLDSPAIERVEFFREVAVRARRYAYTYRLSNYDAVHLASAVVASVDVLMTGDTDFPHGRSIDGVWVDEPYAPGDPTLFGP
ncbi:type II toxin-antitoxin system VapC family toxin [Micromonospora sp. NPDC005171]|uniref:type II toxin-antitoxin system VapC family toxin n=1 Tax=Micromonospora sp. NPDC005171 TaxID=3156866 RepID=UPI0033B9CF3A